MTEWTLQTLIEHFDAFVQGIDFDDMPERNSEEYRQLLFQVANDVIFSEGRYSSRSEYTLELFDVPELCEQLFDMTEINALTRDERLRLRFYKDLGETCHPLFRGRQVDWATWPWLLDNESSSFGNQELCDLMLDVRRPYLAAAILYDLQQLIWKDEETYTCVARQEASDTFHYQVERHWHYDCQSDEDRKRLTEAIGESIDKFRTIESHVSEGRQLGFDHITQTIYDAFDTYISSTYRQEQVALARELAQWINDNMQVGEPHPSAEKLEALEKEVTHLMEKHSVTSPNINYTWMIITLDILGIEEDEEEYEEEYEPNND